MRAGPQGDQLPRRREGREQDLSVAQPVWAGLRHRRTDVEAEEDKMAIPKTSAVV